MATNYDLYRQELQKEKFNSQIQAANAEQQALKNTKNTLQAQGFGSQGYGASQMASVKNSSQNDLATANENYLSSLMALDEAEQAEIEQGYNDYYQTFLTDTNGLTGDEFFEKGSAYDFISKDENGDYYLNTDSDYYKNLDSASQAYLQNYYQDAVDNGRYNSTNYYDTSNFDNNVSYYDKNGKLQSGSISSNFKYETNTLLRNIELGNLKNGDVIGLRNNNDATLYLVYRNGQLYKISDNDYSRATGGRYSITENGNMLDWNRYLKEHGLDPEDYI